MANGLVSCQGTITRKRVTTTRTEESAISFVLVSEDMVKTIEALTIDEKREHVLTRISKTKNGSEHKQSDHNLIETKLKIGWDKDANKQVTKIFNLKNIQCQKKFKQQTSQSTDLSQIFDNEKNLDIATEKFLKRLNKYLYKCFQKVGVKNSHGKSQAKQEKMYDLWKSLKNKTDQDSKAMMEKVEGELAEEYFQNLKEASLDINCAEGGNMQKEIWKLKKHMCPKNHDPPTAMVDKDVTNQEDIKEMALIKV